MWKGPTNEFNFCTKNWKYPKVFHIVRTTLKVNVLRFYQSIQKKINWYIFSLKIGPQNQNKQHMTCTFITKDQIEALFKCEY